MANLHFDLTGDTSGFSRDMGAAEQALIKTKRAGDEVAKSTDAVGKSSKNAAADVLKFSAADLQLANSAAKSVYAVDDLADSLQSVSESSSLTGGAAKAVDDLADGLKSVSESSSLTGGAAEELTKSMGGLGSKITALANPTTAAIAVLTGLAAGMVSVSNSTADLYDKMSFLEGRTGLTKETLLALDAAAKANGKSIDDMQEAISGLAGRIKEASIEGSEASKQFSRLGVEVKDASGNAVEMEDIFANVLAVLDESAAGTERNTNAITLMGESGTKLTAVLQDGTATLDEWRGKTAELAEALDRAGGSAAEFGNRGADLGVKVDTLKTKLGADLLPVMNEVKGLAADVANGWVFWLEQAERLAGAIGLLKKQTNDSEPAFYDYGDAFSFVEAEAIPAAAAIEKATENTIRSIQPAQEAAVAAEEQGNAFSDLVDKLEAHNSAANTFNSQADQRAQAQHNRDVAYRDDLNLNVEAALEAQTKQAEYAEAAFTAEQEQYEAMAALREQNRQDLETNLTSQAQSYAQFAADVSDIVSYWAEDQKTWRTKMSEDYQAAIDRDTAILTDGQTAMTDAEKAQIQARLDANRTALAENEAAQKRALKAAFIAQKTAALTQAIVNVALGITSALALPYPANLVAAAATGIAGALQIGIIAAQSPPQFRRGGVVGDNAPRDPNGQSDSRLVSAEPGEVILNPEQQRALAGGGLGGPIVVLVQVGQEQVQRAVAKVLQGPEARRMMGTDPAFTPAW